ncbi:MAG: amidohydrolase family protein, partial [Candidatus Microthrix parvicella]|nr:amidohydrolase family protein [Candidatus Microthrix parvicella]
HTHYDAQLHWDPTASPSNLHGVTSVVAGNCGFTLAPLQPGDGDYVARMMAKVEGMPLEALERGLDWSWESFGDFLDRLDGSMALNAGFLVGHSAIRRYVVGADGQREATPDEIEAMAALLRASIEAGGIGFSTSLSFTHSDGDGVPVTSRFANRDEVLTLCGVVSEFEGTSLEFVMDGCLNGYSEDEEDYILEMVRAGQRPMNWNVLTVDSRKADEYLHQLKVGARAAEEGLSVVALTMPTLPGMTQSFGTHCGLWLLPGWKHIMGLPLEQKKEYLRQSGVRHVLAQLAASETGALSRLTTFSRFEIGDTFSEANEGLKGRVVEDIAAERGQEPFDTLVDIVLADDFKTILWPLPTDDDDASWELRRQVWEGSGAILGGSDAGAHLDRMLGSNYPSKFLGDSLRGRQLVSLERAVQMMTQVPARLFGLTDRGTIEVGNHADLVLFDPATVDSGPITMRADLPGGTERLFADAVGIAEVWVNGTTVVADGEPTGAVPGTLLRSGTDTHTPDFS